MGSVLLRRRWVAILLLLTSFASAVPQDAALSTSSDPISSSLLQDSILLYSNIGVDTLGPRVIACESDGPNGRVFALSGAVIVDFSPLSVDTSTTSFTSAPNSRNVFNFTTQLSASEPSGSQLLFTNGYCAGSTLILLTQRTMYSVLIDVSSSMTSLTWIGPTSPPANANILASYLIRAANTTTVRHVALLLSTPAILLVEVNTSAANVVRTVTINIHGWTPNSMTPLVVGGFDASGVTGVLWVMDSQTTPTLHAADLVLNATAAIVHSAWNTSKYIALPSGTSLLTLDVISVPSLSTPYLIVTGISQSSGSPPSLFMSLLRSSSSTPKLVTGIPSALLNTLTGMQGDPPQRVQFASAVKYPRIFFAASTIPAVAAVGIDLTQSNMVSPALLIVTSAANTGSSIFSGVSGIAVSAVGSTDWFDASALATRAFGAVNCGGSLCLSVWQQVVGTFTPPSPFLVPFSQTYTYGPMLLSASTSQLIAVTPFVHPWVSLSIGSEFITSTAEGTLTYSTSLSCVFSPPPGPLTSSPQIVSVDVTLSNGWLSPLFPLNLTYQALYPSLLIVSQPPSTLDNPTLLYSGNTVTEVIEIGNTGSSDLTVNVALVSTSPWASFSPSFHNPLTIPSLSTSVVTLIGIGIPSLSVGSNVTATYQLTTNDPSNPSVTLTWAATVKSFVSMAVVSLSQPVNVPSNPVYVTATVAAGVYTTASVYVINTGTQTGTIQVSFPSPPYWLTVMGQTQSPISAPNVASGNSIAVSVGFNFTSPQSGPIASSVDQFGVTAFPSETASFSVTITYPGQPASPIIAGVAVLVMTPGASNAATSTYQILSGATIGPAITLDPSSAMYYRASKSVALSVVVGNQIQIAVTPRDSFGNAQTKSIALGTVTASSSVDATISVQVPSHTDNTPVHVVSVTYSVFTAETIAVTIALTDSNGAVADTVFLVTLAQVNCAAGTARDSSGARCIGCTPGTYSTDGLACLSCSSGSYSGVSSPNCTQCQPGQYDVNRISCQNCAPGTYSNGAVSACLSCPANYHSDGGASQCSPCAAGTERPATSTSNQCQSCTGNSMSVSGQPCTPCSLGSITNAYYTECTPCDQGYVQVGSTCQICRGGTTSGNGSISCIPCSPGTAGDGLCTPCPEGYFISLNGSSACLQCGDGVYSAGGASECTTCPSVGMSCLKGIRTFDSDYWRGYNDWNVSVVNVNTKFFACDNNACNTSADGNVQCAGDHTGPLCSLCVDGYATSPNGGCVKCPNPTGSVILAVFVGTALTVLVCLLILKAARTKPEAARPVIIFKVFINYIQMIATLRLFSGRAPVLIKTIFGVGATVDGFSLDNVVIQCAIKIGFWNQVSVFLLMPFFAVAVPPLITYILYQLHRKCLPGKPPKAKQYKSLAATSVVILLFIIYNKVAITIFSIFNVYPDPIDGHYFLKADYTVEAFTPTFYTFVVFGVIMMVMYLATIPTVSMMVLKRKGAERYTDVSFKRIIGFLYDGYKPQYFWWEGVILFRKAALVIIAVFIRDDFFQVFLSIVLVILCLMLQIVVHPFGTAVITTGSLSASRASLPVQGPMAYLQPQESKPSAVQTASDDVVVQSNRNTFTIVSKAGSTESLVVTHRSSDDLNFLETLSLIATLVTMLGCLLYIKYSSGQYDNAITAVLIGINMIACLPFIWFISHATFHHVRYVILKKGPPPPEHSIRLPFSVGKVKPPSLRVAGKPRQVVAMEVDVIEGDAGVEVKVHQNINNDRDAVEQSDVVDDASDSPHTERITSA